MDKCDIEISQLITARCEIAVIRLTDTKKFYALLQYCIISKKVCEIAICKLSKFNVWHKNNQIIGLEGKRIQRDVN